MVALQRRRTKPQDHVEGERMTQVLTSVEHSKGLISVADILDDAHAALWAGQPDRYKAKLQSAFISIQVLLKLEVK